MGDKIHSREFAVKAGVPVAPSVTQSGSVKQFVEDAAQIGFPLLIKASAGGGGKGMSIVRNAAELPDSDPHGKPAKLSVISQTAGSMPSAISTGRAISKYRSSVMVKGKSGIYSSANVLCNVAFRKLLRNLPRPSSPLPCATKSAQQPSTWQPARTIVTPGTVEFILDPSGDFFFLEMNTRLQVEHPVTEMVCGVDLVEAQLRVAAGEGLPWAQADITQNGHAIECRICCEEPDNDFRPATGAAQILRLPETEGARFDGGIREGQIISAAFDSMVGKLICHGDDRNGAIDASLAALDELILLGVSNNIDYLGAILGHDAFREGVLHTGFITEHAEDLAPAEIDETDRAAILIAAALGVDDFRSLVFDTPEPYASIGGWRN